MHNNCWYNLNIDFSNALRKDWVWNIPDPTKRHTSIVHSELFNQSWLDYMSSIGIPVHYVMLFYRNSEFTPNTAHVDIISDRPLAFVPFAMNWVIGGKDSEMLWYKLPLEKHHISYTMANTPYVQWPISELKEIDKVTIKNSFTMVRTDIPHTVYVQNEPRWCLSIRSDHEKFTWEQAVEHFRSKNLLIER